MRRHLRTDLTCEFAEKLAYYLNRAENVLPEGFTAEWNEDETPQTYLVEIVGRQNLLHLEWNIILIASNAMTRPILDLLSIQEKNENV
jgi:hypothetical protein